MNKKVSIIIPCYNHGAYVKDALGAAVNQTYANIEIICINDGSTDNTREAVRQFMADHKDIIFIDNSVNQGVIAVRNQAIEASSGDYILPLDADDMIDPTYVEKATKILDKNPQIGVVYCKTRLFGDKDEELVLPPFSMDILFSNCVNNCALFRKSDFLEVGKYKAYMKNGLEDWDLWLSFLEKGCQFFRIEEPLLLYRQYKGPSRSDLACSHLEELFQNIVRHHPKLYLTSDTCIRRIFKQDYEPKYRKYKKLWHLALAVIVVEMLALLFILYRWPVAN